MEKLKCLICGMRVNNKNHNINDHAIIEKNEKDKFITCPFCGVGKIYLDNKKEIYKVDYTNLDDESIKILENAMKLEVFNGEFYEEASKLAKDEKVKKIFKDLSNIEFMHARIHKRLGGFEKLPILSKPDYTRHNTDELLLKEARKREEHAVEFYNRNSIKISSSVIKEVFEALSNVEKQHMLITKIDG